MVLKAAFGLSFLAAVVALATFPLDPMAIWRPLAFLAAPVLFTGVAVLRPRWWTIMPAAGVVWVIVILGAASAGLLYLPSALALTVAAVQTAFGRRGSREAS